MISRQFYSHRCIACICKRHYRYRAVIRTMSHEIIGFSYFFENGSWNSYNATNIIITSTERKYDKFVIT
nr:MAG TPA: hypothetical protein [Caudoviricetes sp.]